MATDALVERVFATDDYLSGSVVAAVRGLQESIDTSAAPKGVAETAALLGLSPHTLRYYEQERLVRPSRDASGYRQYTPADLRRLVFLTRMRISGMTIGDLKRYIALADEGPTTIPQRRQIMLQQRDRIRRQLRELALALETTEYKINVYDGHPDDIEPGP